MAGYGYAAAVHGRLGVRVVLLSGVGARGLGRGGVGGVGVGCIDSFIARLHRCA